jgi:hypothetical protein
MITDTRATPRHPAGTGGPYFLSYTQDVGESLPLLAVAGNIQSFHTPI